MKNRGLIIFLIVILTLLALAITGGMFMLLSGRGNFGFFNFFNVGRSTVSSELIFDKKYDEVFKELAIDADVGDIYINHSNNNEVTVKIYGDAKQLDVSDEDNLSIRYVAKKCVGICINVEKSKIEINLPKDYDGKLNIINKYGDTKVSEFMKANAEINNDYGDIEIDAINEGKVDNSCGDIKIGTIAVADVDNNYGDIKLEKVLSSLEVNADCGDIKIDEVNIDKNSRIENSMGNIVVGQTNSIRIDAETSLGKVNVRNNDYKSDIILTIDNSCGDITVRN